MTDMEQFEYRREQDEIVRRKLAVAPLRFEANGKEMMYCYPDSQHELAGWILYRHPDGQWVTLRKATDEDVRRMSESVSRCFHANAKAGGPEVWAEAAAVTCTGCGMGCTQESQYAGCKYKREIEAKAERIAELEKALREIVVNTRSGYDVLASHAIDCAEVLLEAAK